MTTSATSVAPSGTFTLGGELTVQREAWTPQRVGMLLHPTRDPAPALRVVNRWAARYGIAVLAAESEPHPSTGRNTEQPGQAIDF
jgi:hypothetical protein